MLHCKSKATSSQAAQPADHEWDWRSGNMYNWNQDLNGTTHLRGNNFQNGTQWNTDIKPDGSMRGFDANRNYWTYDSRTGNYMNYGTGKMCFGKDYRVCN